MGPEVLGKSLESPLITKAPCVARLNSKIKDGSELPGVMDTLRETNLALDGWVRWNFLLARPIFRAMLVLGSVPAMWYIVFEGFLLSRRVSHEPPKTLRLLKPTKMKPIGSMGLVYLPTFRHKNQPSVGKYASHMGSFGKMIFLEWNMSFAGVFSAKTP